MISAETGLVGVLLAAGKGRRFGGDKGLALLPDGVPMALRSALNLQAATQQVFCVVRPGDAALQDVFIAHGFTVVVAQDAELGMSASLQTGMLATPDVAGWMVALADMPLIKAETYQRLTQVFVASDQITMPCPAIPSTPPGNTSSETAEAVCGHPVIFPARFQQQLLALRGDRGAKRVLSQNESQIQRVFVDDPGILQDFDTRQAFNRLFI